MLLFLFQNSISTPVTGVAAPIFGFNQVELDDDDDDDGDDDDDDDVYDEKTDPITEALSASQLHKVLHPRTGPGIDRILEIYRFIMELTGAMEKV